MGHNKSRMRTPAPRPPSSSKPYTITLTGDLPARVEAARPGKGSARVATSAFLRALIEAALPAFEVRS